MPAERAKGRLSGVLRRIFMRRATVSGCEPISGPRLNIATGSSKQIATELLRRGRATETITEHEAVKPQCPKCGSKKVTFVPGRFFVVTSRKS